LWCITHVEKTTPFKYFITITGCGNKLRSPYMYHINPFQYPIQAKHPDVAAIVQESPVQKQRFSILAAHYLDPRLR
jgi:hypothetical protein